MSGQRAGGLTAAVVLSAGLFLGACASTPPAPTTALDAAKLAISNAERADAGRFAAADLTDARNRLASAEVAVQGRRMIQAERLADESRADAELASAKTDATKAGVVNDDMRRSNGTLIEEMQRNSGSKP
jgi:hypothetical protein